MAASSKYHSSFGDLQVLYETVRSKSPASTLTLLPDRPPPTDTDIHPYLNSAMSLLGKATNYCYFDHDIVDRRVDELQIKMNKVDKEYGKFDRQSIYIHKRLDQVEKGIKGVKDDVKSVKDDINAVKFEVKVVREEVKTFKEMVDQRFKKVDNQFNEVNRQFGYSLAFQRNRLVRVLDAQIEKVAGMVEDKHGILRNKVSADFPTTVWQFWLLKSKISALQRLAKHYEVEGWQDWKMMDSGDLESTQYHLLEDAVIAHPERCHRALAVKWGLEYSQLQRLEIDDQPINIAHKRKAGTDTDTRHAKQAKLASASEYSKTELSIVSTDGEEAIVRRRTIEDVNARVPLSTSLSEIIQEYGERQLPNMDDESGDVLWSDSSTRGYKHRLRAGLGADPPSPDNRPISRVRTD